MNFEIEFKFHSVLQASGSHVVTPSVNAFAPMFPLPFHFRVYFPGTCLEAESTQCTMKVEKQNAANDIRMSYNEPKMSRRIFVKCLSQVRFKFRFEMFIASHN